MDALARNGDMPAAERLLERATDLATKQGAWWHASYCWYVLAVIAVRVPFWAHPLPVISYHHAATLSAFAGLPPPVEAFGAVVAGYARQLSVAPAFAAVKRFHAAGGSPDAQVGA